MNITRADQSESTSGMESLSAHLEIKFDEIENLTLQKAIEKHDAMIAEPGSKADPLRTRAHEQRDS